MAGRDAAAHAVYDLCCCAPHACKTRLRDVGQRDACVSCLLQQQQLKEIASQHPIQEASSHQFPSSQILRCCTAGIVHRDVKLENLLLSHKDSLDSVKLADFGLCKDFSETALQTMCGSHQ